MTTNRVALTLGLVLMDVCWLYPWSALLGTWTDPPRENGLLSPATILAILLLSAATTYMLGRLLGRARQAKLTMAGLATLVAIAAVRVEHYSQLGGVDWVGPLLAALAATIGQLSGPVLAFALALYLWYRGVRIGNQTPTFTDVEGAFRWGIARLAVFGLILVLTRRLEAQTTPYVVGFFFVSLLTLALARLESLRTRTRAPSVNTQWLGVLIVVASAVVLLALLLGQIVSFDLVLVATRPLFNLLGSVLLLIAYIVVIPLAFVIEWLVYLILSLVHPDFNRPQPEPLDPADLNNALQRFLAEQVPPEVLFGLKAAGAALLVVIALAIVVRGLSRWRPSAADADATNEERDSLWDAHTAWAAFLAWFRHLFGRRRAQPQVAAASLAEPSSQEDGLALDSVRALYARLLREGEQVGAVRQAPTTPLEHVAALEQSLEPETSIEVLTAAYIKVRYGDIKVDQGQTDELRDRLARVRPKDVED